MDAPLVFDDSNLESQYRPDNDNNRYNGPTRLREGLYRSINLVSMRVLIEIGAGPTLDYVRRFGFDTGTFPRNTQLAIGGGTMAVTPMEMAAAYAVFANGGYGVTPYIVGRVLDINGNTVFEASHPQVCRACDEAPAELPEQEPANLEDLFAEQGKTPVEPAVRVVDERNAFIMHSMLGDVIRRGTGRRALALERDDLAGKTGTTNDAADTWFNGYNPDVVTTVWVGFPDHSPLGEREYGSSTPLPIWIDYMDVALDERSGIVSRPTARRIDHEDRSGNRRTGGIQSGRSHLRVLPGRIRAPRRIKRRSRYATRRRTGYQAGRYLLSHPGSGPARLNAVP